MESSDAFTPANFNCLLEGFGEWTKNGEHVGKSVAVAALPMPRALGIVSLCKGGADADPHHLVVGRRLTDCANMVQ